MKVYIAAPFECREMARRLQRLLVLHKVEVVSRWISEEMTFGTDADNREFALNDLHDIATADLLVALNPEGWERKGTGGRHVEVGFALGIDLPVLLVGERSNVFHWLPAVTQIDEGQDVVKHVKKLLGV